jgi:ABC-type multidrug transport system ATPase subunit
MIPEIKGMSAVPAQALVEMADLTKTYGDFYAVKHLSASVAWGQRFALFGPNGARKTTTIRMLMGSGA